MGVADPPSKIRLFKPGIPRWRKLRNLMERYLETELIKKDRKVKQFQFGFPWWFWGICTVSTVLILSLVEDWETASNQLYVWIFYTIPPMGKEILIPTVLSDADAPPAFLVGLGTFVIDAVFSLFIIWNYDWVKKIPYFGPKMKVLEEKGRDRVARSRWFSKASFAAVIFFVFVPLQGSGGVGGTILGRVLGMNPYMVLLAVLIGSSIGSFGYAYLYEDLIEPYIENTWFYGQLSELPVVQIFLILIFAGLLIFVIRNPKKAATQTTVIMDKTLDLAEKAVIKTGNFTRETTQLTVMGTMETIDRIQDMGDRIDDVRMNVTTGPFLILGEQGKEFAIATKEKRKIKREEKKEKAKKFMIRTIDRTENTATKTLDAASDLTVVGFRAVKNGVKRSEYIIIFAGEKIEKVIQVPKDALRSKNNKKPGKDTKSKHIQQNGKKH